MVNQSTKVDRIYQLAYRCAYQLLKIYWALIPTMTHGALVAVWHDEHILLVRNSYRRCYNLPGGHIGRGETSRQAACRELLEEVGVSLSPDRLTQSTRINHRWEYKNDHVEIYEVHLDRPPETKIDRREVVAADLFGPEEALGLDLFPPLRTYIEQYRTAHEKA